MPEGATDADAGEGGLVIPLDDNANPETFRTTVALVSGEMDRLASMRASAGKLPLAKPLPEATITSRFGAQRLDPFHRPASSGIDFLAVTGYPVRATAAGTVTTAGDVGGYGNMVEIDHGGGVATRYGHLSAILVTPAQKIERAKIVDGQAIRPARPAPISHYEVRLDGTPVDPMRFISAGTEIAPLL